MASVEPYDTVSFVGMTSPNNVTQLDVSFEPGYFYSSGACMFLIGVMGIGGNFLLLCVMKRPHLKNKSYAHFLSALAVSDSINILFLFFRYANSLVKAVSGVYLTRHFQDIGCQVLDFVEHIFIFNSAWLIVCVTVERFLVIYFPCRGRIFCRARRALTVVLAVALVSCCSQAIRPFWVVLDASGMCSFRIDGGEALATGFDIFFESLLFYLIPSMTILILNILTLIRMNGFLQNSSNSTVSGPGSSHLRQTGADSEPCTASCLTASSASAAPSSGQVSQPTLLKYFPRLRRNSRRATWILLSISFTYMICCLPHLLVDLYWHIKIVIIGGLTKDDEIAFFNYLSKYRYVLKVFRVFNYGSNFYTYVLFGKSFRREVSTLIQNFSSSSGAAAAVQAFPMMAMGPEGLAQHHCHALMFNDKANGVPCCRRFVSDNLQPLLTPRTGAGEVHIHPACYRRMNDIPN